jgi:vacuolar-type H+-ATPase subunit E/Vma4
MIRQPANSHFLACEPEAELRRAYEAADQALRIVRDARKAIRRMGLPAESVLREAIGEQLDAVLRRLETAEAATLTALTVMADAPYLSGVQAAFRQLEDDRLALAAEASALAATA